jgi:hypothetical protein
MIKTFFFSNSLPQTEAKEEEEGKKKKKKRAAFLCL